TAVFIPCAFISGIVGQFFRQFALTIAVSTLISAFNSLTLSPALSVLLLRPRAGKLHEPLPRISFPLLFGFLGYHFASGQLLEWLASHSMFHAPAIQTGVAVAVALLFAI